MAILIQLCKSSASQVSWSPSCGLWTKRGGQTQFFTHSNICSSSYIWTQKHAFDFSIRATVLAAGEHCSVLWEGRCGAERTVSVIPLQCCALCCWAGAIPPVAAVQSKQVGPTSCTTWPSSSPWRQQDETASHVQIHPHDLQLSCSQGIASPHIRWRQRMTSPIAFDNFTLGLIRPRLGKKDMATQDPDCCLWPDSTSAGALSCENRLTQAGKHLDLAPFRAWLFSMEYWQTGCPALTEEARLINGSHVSSLEKWFTQAN